MPTPSGPQHCSCPWCGKDFKSKNKLKVHIGDEHKEEHAQHTANGDFEDLDLEELRNASGKLWSTPTYEIVGGLFYVWHSHEDELLFDYREWSEGWDQKRFEDVCFQEEDPQKPFNQKLLSQKVLLRLRSELHHRGIYTGNFEAEKYNLQAAIKALVHLTQLPLDTDDGTDNWPEWPQDELLKTTFQPQSIGHKKQQELLEKLKPKKPEKPDRRKSEKPTVKKPDEKKKPQKYTVEKPVNHEKKPKSTAKPEKKTAVLPLSGGGGGGGAYISSLFVEKTARRDDDDDWYCAEDLDEDVEDVSDEDTYGDDGDYDDYGDDYGDYGDYDDYGDDYGDY